MASFQVEIAPSSPFGCAAIHNRRDPCFQNNLIELTDLWVHRPQWQSNERENNNNNNNNNTHSSSNHRNKWAKAREMVLSVDHGPTKAHNSSTSEPSHSRKLSFEVSNLGGVSSLVQKWKGFEATLSPNNNPSTKNNNNNTTQENVEPPTPTPTPTIARSLNEDDSLGDWEPISGPPSSRSRDSDTTDIERLRVADIIRKWKDNDGIVCESPPPRIKLTNTTSSDQSEQRCFTPPANSLRIRGRQAYNDLLMQIELNRKEELQGLVERKPVSNFSHRGRIQAMLRFRFLRRAIEAKEAIQPHVTRTREGVNPSAQNGSIRSKELTDNNDTCTTQNECVTNKQVNENRSEEVNNSSAIQDSEVSITPRQHDVSQSFHEDEDTQKNGRLFHRYENLGHEKNPFSILIRQEHNEETNISLCNKEEDDAKHNLLTKINYDPIGECEDPPSYQEDELASSQDLVDTTSMYWVSDGCVSNTDAEWDESQSENQVENNREWIDEVSRPRSDWENLRQARYQEMLDRFSENEDIRVLLGRKSVSTFLSSDLRDKIDQVMASRAQGPQTPKNNRIREEKHETTLSEQDEGQEDYNDQNFDEYEEPESSIGQHQQYNESDDYTDQVTISSPPESWPQNQLGSGDYSYLAASPSTQQSNSSNYYSQNSRPNSSGSSARPGPTIDMELVIDLRRHMQQLHQEMSELRKSIKCCVDMQIELQRSIKKEVQTAMQHSEAKNRGRRNAMKKVEEKCCACCKMQVDTLLYNEVSDMQSSKNGRCPTIFKSLLNYTHEGVLALEDRHRTHMIEIQMLPLYIISSDEDYIRLPMKFFLGMFFSIVFDFS
ncbi:hypothetical protein CASFOL_039025 [Castilleja foliolosa]|uniref:Uncharacterized protein n=1 Tax=Castilleja foliolosa TaxID=1961234 RepID=A0ABD3BHV2_9LAMI